MRKGLRIEVPYDCKCHVQETSCNTHTRPYPGGSRQKTWCHSNAADKRKRAPSAKDGPQQELRQIQLIDDGDCWVGCRSGWARPRLLVRSTRLGTPSRSRSPRPPDSVCRPSVRVPAPRLNTSALGLSQRCGCQYIPRARETAAAAHDCRRCDSPIAGCQTNRRAARTTSYAAPAADVEVDADGGGGRNRNHPDRGGGKCSQQ